MAQRTKNKRPLEITIASWLLRSGLAFVFLYAGIDGLLNPIRWLGFMPEFMTVIAPAETMLSAFSVFEIILAAALLWNVTVFYAALVAAGMLAGMTVFNLSALLIVFRDIGLAAAALALAALHLPAYLKIRK